MTKPRRTSEFHFHHVTIHGHNQIPIFQARTDRLAFLRILSRVHEKYPFSLLAYCIMPNHYHLLIRSEAHSLSLVMASINLRYSLYFKQQYGHKGTLYDQRFFSKITPSSRYILNTSFYIHCNPVHNLSPLSSSPELYEFSSYRYYYHANLQPPPYLQRDLLYSHLPINFPQNLESYIFLMSRKRFTKNKPRRIFYLRRKR